MFFKKKCKNKTWLFYPPSWKKHVSEVSVQKSEYSSYYLMNIKILYGTYALWGLIFLTEAMFCKIYLILFLQGTFKKKVAQIPGFPLNGLNRTYIFHLYEACP